jgi:hypothetical protein
MFNEKFPKFYPKWLKNPKTDHLLELDGYCDKLKIAFEHNGLQHYKKTNFHSTNKKFQDLQYRDRLKRQLCKSHGVKLIVIPQIGNNINKKGCVTRVNLKKFIFKQLKEINA